jgi:hypothetical protein
MNIYWIRDKLRLLFIINFIKLIFVLIIKAILLLQNIYVFFQFYMHDLKVLIRIQKLN